MARRAVRYPRGSGLGVDISAAPHMLEIGKAEVLTGGEGDAVIVAYGSMVEPAMNAASRLEAARIKTTVINARFAKPLDEALILETITRHRLLITVEEAYLAGGFGSAVIELLEAHGLLGEISVVRMGVPDQIVTHGDPKKLLGGFGLDADGIYSVVKERLESLDSTNAERPRLKAVK